MVISLILMVDFYGAFVTALPEARCGHQEMKFSTKEGPHRQGKKVPEKCEVSGLIDNVSDRLQ